MFVCVTDKAEASTLPTYGQRESSAGCSLSLSHLPAHQKEAPVSPHMYAAVVVGGRGGAELHGSSPLQLCVSCFQGGHGGVDGHSGGVAV